MSNPSKKKGTAFENCVLEGLRHIFPTAERTPAKGSGDIGDFLNTGDITIEAKAVKAWTPASWLKEAEREARNAKRPYYAVVIKRRGTTDPLAQYVLTDMRTLLDLL